MRKLELYGCLARFVSKHPSSNFLGNFGLFSHFHLDMHPQQLLLRKRGCVAFEGNDLVWYNTHRPDARGLAAPVARLLDELI